MKSKRQLLSVGLVSLMLPVAGLAQDMPVTVPAGDKAAARDWLTWGYDQERTGWNRGETVLTRDNVSKLKLIWSTQLSTAPTDVVLSTLTAPLVAEGVNTAQGSEDLVFLLGADDTLFALDANSGKMVWHKDYPNPIRPVRRATWECPNTPNDTPVIDKPHGIIYFITSDGKLRGVSLNDGAERLKPLETLAPFTRAWSLNLVGSIIYTTSGRACGEVIDASSPMVAALAMAPGAAEPGAASIPIDPSAVTAVDVADPANPKLTRFFTSGGRPAAPWGRGGVAKGPGDSVILETSDGLYDPGSGNYGDTILELSRTLARVRDSFTPADHRRLNAKDLAGSTSPVVFPFGNKTLVAVSQKQAILYLLDANDLGGGPVKDHASPFYKAAQLGNDAESGTTPAQGVWGGITTYETPDNKRFLYVPMWGPPSKNGSPFQYNNGPTPNGSIMALEVVADGDKIATASRWISPDMIMPDPPVVANGVVYAISTGGQAYENIRPDGFRYEPSTTGAHYRATPVGNLVLYAMDAQTGKVLYSSKKVISDWVHFSEPVVALGKVFVETHDAHVYAFGLKH